MITLMLIIIFFFFRQHFGRSFLFSIACKIELINKITPTPLSYESYLTLVSPCSATESEGQLMECLNHCVQMIDRIGNVTRDVAMLTPTPLQTQTLLAKVRDVADTYLQTVQAAGKAIGKDMNDPSMGVLMKKATSLASVLTTLMRSLRVFT